MFIYLCTYYLWLCESNAEIKQTACAKRLQICREDFTIFHEIEHHSHQPESNLKFILHPQIMFLFS